MGSGMGHQLWGQLLIRGSPEPHFSPVWVAIYGSQLRSPFMGVRNVASLGPPAPSYSPTSRVKNPMDGYLSKLNSLSEYSHSS